ncbi:DUF305 domain-containing protein [Haloechinothrix halophila]|uniref:DUF305 domain-containing protein n=1 Tax=Haloechinothrix halophila TaxID=1069073 RepID=UPI000402A901|nr:DUF305 domain-containing protein [Haloechinothrix halophila]
MTGDADTSAEPVAASESSAAAETSGAPAASGAPGWARAVILGGAGLALLLIGATIGLLIGRSEQPVSERATSPNQVDIGFAQDMTVHHLQAVTMGQLAYARGDDQAIRSIGFDIAGTQQGQVGTMQGWLSLWNAPEQAADDVMTWMAHGSDSGTAHGSMTAEGDAAMPGMATSDDMRKLRSLSGEEFDVFFLQLMLQHHQGGTPMAEYAVANANVQQVRALARSMLTSQGAEITVMKGMLTARGAEPLPF